MTDDQFQKIYTRLGYIMFWVGVSALVQCGWIVPGRSINFEEHVHEVPDLRQ